MVFSPSKEELLRTQPGRYHRLWWVYDHESGRVLQAEGWADITPESKYWWFPSVGWSGCEGYQVFETKEEARDAGHAKLVKERDRWWKRLMALETS